MLTQGFRTDGSTTDVQLLLNLRDTVGTQAQYDDGIWKYAWPWAIYLQKTGDIASVRANFTTPGPNGAALQPSIKDSAHAIAAARTGPGGIIKNTPDIDADGYWTIDDYSALMGLAAYRWLTQQLGDRTEYQWANNEYNSLLGAVNQTLTATITKYGLNYLPCSMLEPNDNNRCSNPEDANWAAPFLFGRWAWDGYLFGAPINGPGVGPHRRHLRLRLRPPAGHPSGEHLRRVRRHRLQHRLQRRLRRVGPGQRPAPRPGHPRLPVHDRQHAERSVLVVGERRCA